jgi:hypothetical protein
LDARSVEETFESKSLALNWSKAMPRKARVASKSALSMCRLPITAEMLAAALASSAAAPEPARNLRTTLRAFAVESSAQSMSVAATSRCETVCSTFNSLRAPAVFEPKAR